MTEPMIRRRTPVKLAAMILLPVAILAGATYVTVRAKPPPVERLAIEERVWTVAATAVAVTDEQPELRLFGEIVAGREVDLRPLVAGRVVEVGPQVVEGGTVREGDLLIAIDPFDYRANVAEDQARLAEIQARTTEYTAERTAEKELIERDRELVALRQREVERRKQLLARGSGSRKALDDSRLALSEQRQRLIVRRQSIDRLSARIDQQRAIETRLGVTVERARRDLERTRLTAPFDAFLVETNIAVGKMVGTGDRVARLIAARRLEARFQMSDDQFAGLIGTGTLRGRSAQVVWRASAREFSFDATIDRWTSEIDAASGGIDIYARIGNVGIGTVLRPGAFVEVRVLGEKYSNVVRVPAQALHGTDTVYVIEDGRLAARKVERIASAGNDVLVRGGLRVDDTLVTTSFAEIGPGVRVEAK